MSYDVSASARRKAIGLSVLTLQCEFLRKATAGLEPRFPGLYVTLTGDITRRALVDVTVDQGDPGIDGDPLPTSRPMMPMARESRWVVSEEDRHRRKEDGAMPCGKARGKMATRQHTLAEEQPAPLTRHLRVGLGRASESVYVVADGKVFQSLSGQGSSLVPA